MNWREAALWVLVPVAMEVGVQLAGFDPDGIPDYKAWAISLGALALRAAAKQAVSYLAAKRLTPNTPEPRG